MKNFRITMTDNCPWSNCFSSSQASLCHYTLKFVSTEFELTFADLRYSFEGNRPSQTKYFVFSLLYKLVRFYPQSGISSVL